MSYWREYIQHTAAWEDMAEKLDEFAEAADSFGLDSPEAERHYEDACKAILDLIEQVVKHGVPTKHQMEGSE